MDMQSTYLSWVDFRNTGCAADDLRRRLNGDARVVMSPGTQFGTGGEGWHRFNIAMPRARLTQAIERIEAAFADLQ
jgi:cystathionine beta-lyase